MYMDSCSDDDNDQYSIFLRHMAHFLDTYSILRTKSAVAEHVLFDVNLLDVPIQLCY
jgi:hypothetical protein